MTPTYELSDAQRQVYRLLSQLALPRHTSYPSTQVWQDTFQRPQLSEALSTEAREGKPLSLYVHVPFCQKLCSYCACNKLILPRESTQSPTYVGRFLDALTNEISRYGQALSTHRRPQLSQLHIGGGTPTYLSPDDLRRLMDMIALHFDWMPEAELAIEIDPRITTVRHLETLRSLGFNRLSLGIQDFDPRVQEAVDRVQPFIMVEEFVQVCRRLQFSSINFDLIYGLPFQTEASIRETLEQVVALSPDRIAFYRLALIPEIFKWQRKFGRHDVPDGDLPLALNLLAINRLLAAGYRFIGLDHFAKPTEALSSALDSGAIRRSFQGMTTGGDTSVIGIGPSAISTLSNHYWQNISDLMKWQRAVAVDFPIQRGISLTEDDIIRREVLQALYCHRGVSLDDFAKRHQTEFFTYFREDAAKLTDLEALGLVERNALSWTLTRPLGELLVRVVAASLDRYLPDSAWRKGLERGRASRVG